MNLFSKIAKFSEKAKIDFTLKERYEKMGHENILKQLRIEKTLTQESIAEVLHISRSAYCRYENGSREIPISLLIRLADIYNTSTDYILGRTKIKTPYPYK